MSSLKRIAVATLTPKGAQEPRLRFDKVAVGLVARLQAALAKTVPDGKTVIVTITAPIWQDSKTGKALEDRIRQLLAARRTRLETTIHGNRIQVRVLKGGAGRTSRLIGFVHNPEPNPKILFDVARSLLACIGTDNRPARAHRWLIIANQDGRAPVATVRQICLALRAWTVFKRILVKSGPGPELDLHLERNSLRQR